MDVHQQVKLLDRGFGEARIAAHPSVIDQKVEVRLIEVFVQQLGDFVAEGAETLALADIQLQHGRTSAQAFDLCNQRLSLIGAAVVSADDIDALSCQMQGGAFAKATAGAGDQCDFTGHGISSR